MNIKQAVVFLTCRAGIEVQRERPGEEPVCFPVYLRRKGGKTMWENQWETGGGDGGEYVDENALSVTVNRLRSKLEDKRDAYSYIQTVYGQGYTWKKESRQGS